MEYRFSKSRAEIVKNMASNLTAECSLTVWQKLDDGSRKFLEKMIFYALFPDEGVFTLKVSKDQIQYIDPKKEIYFLLEGHDFFFKTFLAVDQKEFMTLQIPREVRLKEHRVHERKYYSLDEKIFVDVVFTIKKDENEITLTCPLINLSEGGACIVVSKETISNIDLSAIIQVKITIEFRPAIIRNARVFVKKNLNKDELYAIGVQFE